VREYEARQEGWGKTFVVVPEGLQTKLRVLGILGNKHIPQDYMEASVEQRWELLRGLMDTDGTATEDGHCRYVSKLLGLGQQVLTLVCSLGLKGFYRESWSALGGERYGPYAEIRFTPGDDLTIFKLQRKQDLLVM